MSKKHDQTIDRQALLDELELTIGLYVLALAKATADATKQSRGEMPCPRCLTGTLRYSIAPGNGHARAACDRIVGQSNGQDVRCVLVME